MAVKVTQPEINIREKLSNLDRPTGLAGQAMLRAETASEQQELLGVGRKNWLINGSFRISQRGVFTTVTGASNNAYYVDRWKTYLSGPSGQKLHTLEGYGTKSSYKIIATSTLTGAFGISQIIEDYLYARGETFTFSAWVKSNNSNARLLLGDNSGWFASSNSHSGGGNWEKLTVTGKLKSDATSFTVSPRVSGSTGQGVSITSNDFIEVAEAQLELGRVATPFEYRSYGEELALCQRYYVRFWSIGAASRIALAGNYNGSNHFPTIVLPVPMRAEPSVDYSSLSAFTFETWSSNNGTPTAISYNTRTKTVNNETTAVTLNVVSVHGDGGNLLLRGTSNVDWLDLNAEL